MAAKKKAIFRTIPKAELVKEFTIDRRRWLRGEGDGTLRDLDNHRCCIGFYAGACGYAASKLYHVDTIHDMLNDFLRNTKKENATYVDYPKALRKAFESVNENIDNSSVSEGESIFLELYKVNDDEDISDKEREKFIIKTFKKFGIKVKFIH